MSLVLSEHARSLLENFYKTKGETSPEHAFRRAAVAFCAGDLELAERMVQYTLNGWFMFSSPILSNARLEGEPMSGLPISCFLSYVDDSLEGLIDHSTELRWMSVKGGGVGGHWSDVRTVSDKAPGPIPFLKTVDSDMTAYRQGKCYHPDTEILTENGWVRFEDLTEGVKVAQVGDNLEVSFVLPLQLVKEQHEGSLLRVQDGTNVNVLVTPNHSMVVSRKVSTGWSDDLIKIQASDLPLHSEVRMFKGAYNQAVGRNELTPSEKLMVANQADGLKNRKGSTLEFHFKKQRKVTKLLSILQEGLFSYNLVYRNDGSVTIRVKTENVFTNPDFVSDSFDWVNPTTRTSEWLNAFLEEVSCWDSSKRTDTSFTYSNTNKADAEVVFLCATLCGKSAFIKEYARGGARQNHFTVHIHGKNHFTTQAVTITEEAYSGLVYCALVPTGRLMVRSNGRSLVCGNTRKGSYAAYLDVSHPDILEFLNLRVPTGGDENRKCFNLNNAVNLSDAFMNAVLENKEWQLIDPATNEVKETMPARELWHRILEVRFRTGEPYFFFSDTANKHLPQTLKDKGLKIHGSNLCLAGSERVVTSKGYLTAQELYEDGSSLEVFDGVSLQKATPMQLIERDVPTYTITLKNGLTHTVTGYHKVKTDRGDIACQDLAIGDRVVIQSNKGLFGSINMEDEAFLLGLYQADGTQHKDIVMLDLWEADFDLIPEVEERFARIHAKYGCDRYDVKNQHGDTVASRGRAPATFTTCTVSQSTVAKKRLASKTLKKALDFTKGAIPYWIWEADEATQWQYVRGLFYADGTVSLASCKGEPIYLAITNINLTFIKELQLLLRNLGLPFSLHVQSEERYTLLPDGLGDSKEYLCQKAYRLVCGSKNACLTFEDKTSFLTRKGISLENRLWRDNSRKVSEVVSIEYAGHQDVYCLTVDTQEHCFVANGIVTLNCNEIFLPTSKDRSAVCCLSSVNLEYFDDWKNTTLVEDAITFLDNVLEYFIQHAPAELHKAIFSAKSERSLGLGTMGFHSYLQRKNIPFESPIAKGVNRKIFAHIKQKAVEQTERLAQTRGEYLDGIGTGRRNSHLMAIAPNANSAIILDTSPSIEPWKSNAFTHRTRAGSFLQKNIYLDAKLKTKGLSDEEYNQTWQSIILNRGSVQHLECLTEYEKAVFKTAFEIDQMWLIEHASDRQEFICQGQSLNLFFPAGSDKAYVNAVHLSAWKKGLKGLYYLRTETGVTGEKVSTKIERKALKDYDECISCQG